MKGSDSSVSVQYTSSVCFADTFCTRHATRVSHRRRLFFPSLHLTRKVSTVRLTEGEITQAIVFSYSLNHHQYRIFENFKFKIITFLWFSPSVAFGDSSAQGIPTRSTSSDGAYHNHAIACMESTVWLFGITRSAYGINLAHCIESPKVVWKCTQCAW